MDVTTQEYDDIIENITSVFMNATWFNNTSMDIDCEPLGNLTVHTCEADNGTIEAENTANDPNLKKSDLVSNEVRQIIIIINMAILCQLVSAFGIFANIVNILVFVKMGFQDAINVTLTGMAIADLGVVIFASWLSICFNPLFKNLDLPFAPTDVVYLTAGLPRLSLARASSWILAFASFERCLCITRPLTFRSIITPKRSLIYIIVTFIVMFSSVAPTYYTSRLAKKFDPSRNRTYVGLSFIPDRFQIDNVAFGVGVFLSVTSFLSVSICAVILVFSLKSKTKWRETTVATVAGNHPGNAMPTVSNRNKRVGKMVSLISAIFIVCFTPNTVNQLVMSMVPEFTKNGRYTNANQISWSFGFVAESVNASVNIFMYLKMSSRFRKTLKQMLWGRERLQPDSDLKSSSGYSNNAL